MKYELRRYDQLAPMDMVLDPDGRAHPVSMLPVMPPNTMFMTEVPEYADALVTLSRHFELSGPTR